MSDGGNQPTLKDRESERGRTMFRNVFGPDYGEQLSAQLGESDFNHVLMCRIAPEIWERNETSITTKILCAIAACTAANQNIRYFVRAAIHHGITRSQVEEVILLAGLESGFPAAAAARRSVDEAYLDHVGMLAQLGRVAAAW